MPSAKQTDNRGRPRYRQDTIEITLKCPARLVELLDREAVYSIFGISAEQVALFMLTSRFGEHIHAQERRR
jgi:hypothetical protein